MDFPVFNPDRYSGINSVAYDNLNSSQTKQQTLTQTHQKPQNVVKVQQRLGKEAIKSDSRIQYVPFEKKVVDYVDERKYRVVPKKKVMTDYKDHVRVQMVPKEVTVEDYYAVQYIRCYIPEIIPQKKVEYVPVERKCMKYEYIPVQRQIVHYPKYSLDDQAPKYLGVRQKFQNNSKYENVSEEEMRYWQRQYGYQRGQPINILNEKIRQKYQRDKDIYFQKFQGSNVSTLTGDSSFYHNTAQNMNRSVYQNNNNPMQNMNNSVYHNNMPERKVASSPQNYHKSGMRVSVTPPKK